MNSLFGIRVFESPLVQPQPVLQLHPDFKWCTPEFRAQMNAWLLERFGTQEVAFMFDPRMLGMGGGPALFMNPKHAAMLRLQSRTGESR